MAAAATAQTLEDLRVRVYVDGPEQYVAAAWAEYRRLEAVWMEERAQERAEAAAAREALSTWGRDQVALVVAYVVDDNADFARESAPAALMLNIQHYSQLPPHGFP